MTMVLASVGKPLRTGALPAFAFGEQRPPCADADPEVFFPLSESNVEAVAAAKRICRGCPLRWDCLRWALDTGEDWGIWGAATSGERRRMRRAR